MLVRWPAWWAVVPSPSSRGTASAGSPQTEAYALMCLVLVMQAAGIKMPANIARLAGFAKNSEGFVTGRRKLEGPRRMA